MRALILPLALAVLSLAGCATVPLTPPLADAERQTVIQDTAALLAEQFPAASSPLRFAVPSDPKKADPIAEGVAAALREKGFAVGEARDASLCNVSLDPVDTDGVLLRIAVGDDWAAFRLYQRDPAAGMTAESGFTIRNNKDSSAHE